MNRPPTALSRRRLLAGAAGTLAANSADAGSQPPDLAGKALIAITLDLEMSRNFPTWDQTHWDYEKGNLNPETNAMFTHRVRIGGIEEVDAELIAWLRQAYERA